MSQDIIQLQTDLWQLKDQTSLNQGTLLKQLTNL